MIKRNVEFVLTVLARCCTNILPPIQ